MNKLVKVVGFALGGSALLAGACFAYIASAMLDNPFNNRSFEQDLWLSKHLSMEMNNPRGEMYEDLVDNHLRIGMPKSAGISLLGEPDFKAEQSFMSYNLGMWSGFRVDFDSLDLRFDEQGKLLEIHRVQH